jgi:hypothetical protein
MRGKKKEKDEVQQSIVRGRCRIYVSLSSLATALCRFPNLSHPLPRAWVAFVRIRQMAPRSVGPNEKELQPRMRSWQHQPGTSRVGLNFAGGLSKAKHQAPSAKYQAPSSWACRAAYTAIVPFLAAHTTAVRRGYWTAASSRGVDIRPSQRCGERLQA